MNTTAKAALSSLKPHSASSNALVFDLNGDYVHHTFKKACDDLGIVDFRFHDLRHTAASWLRMTGADIHSVATLWPQRFENDRSLQSPEAGFFE